MYPRWWRALIPKTATSTTGVAVGVGQLSTAPPWPRTRSSRGVFASRETNRLAVGHLATRERSAKRVLAGLARTHLERQTATTGPRFGVGTTLGLMVTH